MAPLTIEVRPASSLAPADHAVILALCTTAYEEDFTPILAQFPDPIHIIGRIDTSIVTHALWVTRWLQPQGHPLLRTAYVEAVATLPIEQGRGHATALIAALPPLLTEFDLAALSPSEPQFYARLGWQSWQGPLAVRTPTGLESTPDEEAMILRLPRTPSLDLTTTLSIEPRDGEAW